MRKEHPLDYSDPKTRREVLIRQRRGIWTPEQVASFARHFRLRPGKKLLDAGCGHGYIMRTYGPFLMPGGRLTGLDREPKLMATAKRLLRRDGLEHAADFVEGDIGAMPFRDNSFHVSIAHVVFCHLREPERALDELIRVTKPGGCVAVFDNAIAGGESSGWSNRRRPPLRQRLADIETSLRSLEGRRRLGHGDFSVGCYLPSWMEARGMRNVDVRSNERVHWIAPPYRSPGQRTQLRNTRERLREKPDRRVWWPRQEEQMRAGGCSEATIRRLGRSITRHYARTRELLRARKLAYAWSGQFWCVWGFKPRKRR